MKTFDRKDIITCINAEDAKKYISKLGYFANGLNGFANIDYFAAYSLDNVQVGIAKPFFYKEQNFALFLPEDKVKEIEESEKYRPFKAMLEFVNTVGKRVGEDIRLRAKSSDPFESSFLIDGYTETSKYELKYIYLSGIKFTPKELFDNYEWFFNGTWKPFGVEE